MSYKVYHNNLLFYDSASRYSKYALINAQLEMVSQTQGTFAFTVPVGNVMHGQFEKYTSFIDVYDNDEIIFAARVIKTVDNLDGSEVINCEGLMAILADTIVSPRWFSTGTLSDLLWTVLGEHNNMVTDRRRQIYLGTIEYNDTIEMDREFLEYETSISRLQKICDPIGGVYRLRHDENFTLYFDWYEDFTDICDQKIEVGANVIESYREDNVEGFCTCIIPLGGTDKFDERITIESVVGHKYIDTTDILVNRPELLHKFGEIYRTVEYPEVESPQLLYTLGAKELKARTDNMMAITITAFDLTKAGISTDIFKTWQKMVISIPEIGLENVTMNCTSISVDLTAPETFRMTLGAQVGGYISATSDSAEMASRVVQQGVQRLSGFRAGETYSGTFYGYGYTTSNSGQAYIELPLTKTIYASTVQITAGTNISIRGTTGLMMSGALADLTINSAIKNAGGLRINVSGLTTRFTAQTPVTFVGNLTLKFS